MSYDSEDLILDAVRVFMTVKVKQMYRQLTILNARQLLVPLHFEYQNMPNTIVTLQLPQGLKMADMFGRDTSPNSESYDRACDLLRETIQVTLRSKNFNWKFLNLTATPKGVKFEVCFDGANPPKPYQLNIVRGHRGTRTGHPLPPLRDIRDAVPARPAHRRTR